ncbi:sulfate transporter-like [Plakobranchus ocellatus]|uniref:Sulfate transporter-like n=1 Tax=Plakobranchus ocellatus TaxID=259542 RepID=A0AAV4E2H6_9GAST|nr:sulfate transporter-like [Plakobranchus ocellatus]
MSSDQDISKPQSMMGQKRRRSSCPAVSISNQVVFARAPFTQTAFDQTHLRRVSEEKVPLKDRLRDNLYCSNRRMWKLLTTYIPVVKFLRYYKLRDSAVNDIIAGLTVGILHIPQALAFGQLTSVKVENGLFTSLWPVLLYVFFGTSAHVSMGTSAVICIMTAATVDREGLAWAEKRPWLINASDGGGDNDTSATSSTLDDVPEYLDYKEELAMGITLIAGVMMIAMGIFKLGFITAYLSESFFTAFTSAAAVHIGTSQLPAMLGIRTPRFGGAFKIIKSYEAIFSVISNANFAAILCAIVACVVILFVKDCINERFKHKMYAPIPIELFVVVFGTVISYFGSFRPKFGLDVVGSIPTDIPAPVIPTEGIKAAPNYVVDCFILAILIFANTIAMAKICAKKHNYEVDDSQEMLAYGMCNAVSAFFKCFPSSVAPPRSMVASSMNAKTTLSGIFASVLMLLVILFISPLFTELPKSVLAAIIFISLKGLFIQIFDGRKFWRINKFDFVIWFFTFFSTVFLDIDLGLGIGVGVSLITVVFQTQFARGFKEGYTKTDPALVEHKNYLDSSEVPGVKIFRFQSSLYFANAEIFRNTLYRNTVNPRKLLKGLKKREQRLAETNKERIALGLPVDQRRNSIMMGDLGMASRDSSSSLNLTPTPGDAPDGSSLTRLGSSDSFTKPSEKIRRVSLPSVDQPHFTIDENKEIFFKGSKSDNKGGVEVKSYTPNADKYISSTNSRNGNNGSTVSLGGISGSSGFIDTSSSSALFKARRESVISINFDEYEEDPEDGDELFSDEKLRRMRKIHHIIIDCVTINYIDASGANVLSHIYTEYGHVNIKVFLAGCSADMRRAMEHAGVFEKIPRDHLFVDVHDAVAIARPQRTLPLEADALEDFSDDEAIEDSYVTKM